MDYTASDGIAGALVAIWTSMMCMLYIIPMMVAAAALVVWIIALVDVIGRDPAEFPNARAGRDDPSERLLWLLIVLLVGALGAAVYYFMVMRPFPRTAHVAAVVPPGGGPQHEAPGTGAEPGSE